MELQFEKTAWPCLMTAAAQAKNEEQTQEVRLGENMPDIGRVLASWGQVLLRGKEWRGSGMTVSAGVMAWVLYAPEDGSEPRMVETWLPVQLKWDFPETNRDGTIIANCQLASVDARSISARKLLVRTVVSVFGEALEPGAVDVWTPGSVPEDVQLLKKSYPVRLPREAGEKSFALDEEFSLPSAAGKLVHYSLCPEITDSNVLGGKAVFRGTALVHLLYEDQEGHMNTMDQEFSFSQFADLDRDYEPDAQVRVVPAVTNLELEMQEPDRVHLKAGMVGQFVVADRPVLEVVEDAYSLRRSVTPVMDDLLMPAQLDQSSQNLRLSKELPVEGDRILESVLYTGQPRLRRDENGVDLAQEGVFQILYEDNGELRGTTTQAEASLSILADGDATIRASSMPVGTAQGLLSGGQINLRGEVSVTATTTADQGIPMVTGMTLGELRQPDPNRPSMILRRSNGQGLWELAKATGSTVADISQINQLQGEPEEDRLLLIPVL